MAYADTYEAPGRWELWQWCGCGLVVLGVHAAIVLGLASRSDDTEAEAGAPVVMLELAPVWAAPRAELSELPPGPQQVESEQIDQTKQQTPNEQQEAALVPEVASGPNPTLVTAAPATKAKDETHPTETREVPESEAREEIHQEASIASAPPSATAVDVRPAGPLPGIDPRAISAALMSWQRLMAVQLERHKHYPPQAHGEQGVATLAFTVDRSGRLLSSRIIRSAGSAILDADALALIKRAQPFPSPPPEIADASLTVRVPIRYIASGPR
jgi:periplasmic protein TonB